MMMMMVMMMMMMLLVICYLLLVTCYLLLVTCYLLLVTWSLVEGSNLPRSVCRKCKFRPICMVIFHVCIGEWWIIVTPFKNKYAQAKMGESSQNFQLNIWKMFWNQHLLDSMILSIWRAFFFGRVWITFTPFGRITMLHSPLHKHLDSFLETFVLQHFHLQ